MKTIRFFTPLLLVLALLGNLLLLSACDDEGEPEKGLMPEVVSVTGVSLSPAETTLAVGAGISLTATVAPANATNGTVSFASSNSAVATVDENGRVTAVAAGTATVTATTADGGKTASCTVHVVEPATLTVMESAHYRVTVPMMSYLLYNTYYGWVNTYAPTGYMQYIFGTGGQALDTGKPLRAQNFSVTTDAVSGKTSTVTWFDYFASLAADTAEQLLVHCEAALENSIALGENEQQAIDMDLQMLPAYASSAGFASTAAYLAARFGDSVTEGDVRAVLELSQLAGKQAEAKTAELEDAVTNERLEAYYAANRESLDLYVDVISYTFSATFTPTGDATADADAFAAYTAKKQVYAARTAALAACTERESFCALLLQYCKEDGMTDAEAAATVDGAVHFAYKSSEDTALENWLFGDAPPAAGSTGTFDEISDTSAPTKAGEVHYTVCYVIAPPHRDEAKVQHVGHILFMDSTFSGLTNADTLTGETKALAERLLARGEALSAENMAKELVALMLENGDLTQATNAAGDTIYGMEKKVFETYGNTYTEDGNVFYDNVTRGYMVAEFDAWLYHPARTVGEVSLTAVKTTYGYHIMYYAGEGEAVNWTLTAFEAVTNADYEAWYTAAANTHTRELQLENLAFITP